MELFAIKKKSEFKKFSVLFMEVFFFIIGFLPGCYYFSHTLMLKMKRTRNYWKNMGKYEEATIQKK